MDENVASFQSITGTDNERVARGYLEISGGDVMQAIQLFFESPELSASFTTPSQGPPASTPAAARGTAAPARTVGRQDASGVIHIDSDDEEDIQMSQADDHDDNIVIPDDDEDEVAAVARTVQEEEDAAMARRLQDEMYSQEPGSVDGVRAPMSRTTETLVDPHPAWGMDDDREAAVLDELRRRRQARAGPANPFSQSIWDDPDAPGIGAPPVPLGSRAGSRPGGPPEPDSAQRRLADLFCPPYDLLSRLSWDDARQEGKEQKKWIMVNVQDASIFQCQVLNRDHWKDSNIKSLIYEHFIFLQYDKSDPQSREYITFYFGQGVDDPNNYPHISIIDPRTGEQVKTWSGLPLPTTLEFHADLVEFLDRYSLAANSKNPVPKTKPKTKPVDYGRMTEEEMLEMALKNSMEVNGGSVGPSIEDPDQPTKSDQEIGKGKGKEEAEPSESASPFSQITRSNPHIEPENNSATTTRIQFRHPAGRVIRRFAVADPVRRIYEWLKAEPLEGKEGIKFELKANPGGDLISSLDKTIEEAHLKQGTVMIEFVEDEN
ncbi:uncharacterized protein BCR38DRAFT_240662 [Pseudomassariella vexata]|uniref:UBX domain-containing protein n=1 Tax=Pseudomassariella vexata TaxID=1141098 RepID=A0A1Y2DT77_9PEZI|nr:uncharacterized protein BCR38DRAFT_240662 [Pseudomassariella vexata]ORY62473.1 hypothetical protein BCR38DRAFT_240662 [Pseudomassariella vexata]